MFSRLAVGSIKYLQIRTNTTIVKRVYEPFFVDKRYVTQEELNDRAKRHPGSRFIKYRIDEEPHPDALPNKIKVLLLNTSEDFGKKGMILNLDARIARQGVLLPGLGVYATPANLEKYSDIVIPEGSIVFSSKNAESTMKHLSRTCVAVRMNLHNPWVIQPSHVRASLRNMGFFVPLESIDLADQQIQGPDITNLEMKEFYANITINRTEKVVVRCIIHHWSSVASEIIPLPVGWNFRFNDPVFEKDSKILTQISRPPFDKTLVIKFPELAEDFERYKEWRRERDNAMRS